MIMGRAIVVGRDGPPVSEVSAKARDSIAPPVGDPAVLVGHRPRGRGRDGGDQFGGS
jgi:hypothetical protein